MQRFLSESYVIKLMFCNVRVIIITAPPSVKRFQKFFEALQKT